MNSFVKYCPNVFVAKCSEPYEKGDIATLTTKYRNEVDVIIHNLIKQDEQFHYYSYTRADGTDSQTRALRKAERYQTSANNANKRSNGYCEAAREGSEFLSLGEPVKRDHHSAKSHLALFERNRRRMDKAVEEFNKVEDYTAKAAYWEKRANNIDLSMPESLDYFQFKLEEAKKQHQFLKDNPEKRPHSYALTYAKKEVNEIAKKLKIAELLWK